MNYTRHNIKFFRVELNHTTDFIEILQAAIAASEAFRDYWMKDYLLTNQWTSICKRPKEWQLGYNRLLRKSNRTMKDFNNALLLYTIGKDHEHKHRSS